MRWGPFPNFSAFMRSAQSRACATVRISRASTTVKERVMTILDEGRITSVCNEIFETFCAHAQIHKGRGTMLRNSLRKQVRELVESEAAEHDQARIAWQSEHSS